MNGYTVWIFSFYPIFLQMIFMLKKCNASDYVFITVWIFHFTLFFFRWFLCWKSAIPRIGFLLQWIVAREKHVYEDFNIIQSISPLQCNRQTNTQWTLLFLLGMVCWNCEMRTRFYCFSCMAERQIHSRKSNHGFWFS